MSVSNDAPRIAPGREALAACGEESGVSQGSPADIIKASSMGFAQYVLIGLCVLTYAADGIDVASITYAAPAMIAEWGVRPEAFGLVYSVTPIGIVISSFFFAPLGDRFGRRAVTLTGIGVM